MRRNFQAANTAEVVVGVPVQRVGEQALHLVGAILSRRQADRMNHKQLGERACGPGTKIRRGQMPGKAVPAVLPQRRARWGDVISGGGLHAVSAFSLTPVRFTAVNAAAAR